VCKPRDGQKKKELTPPGTLIGPHVHVSVAVPGCRQMKLPAQKFLLDSMLSSQIKPFPTPDGNYFGNGECFCGWFSVVYLRSFFAFSSTHLTFHARYLQESPTLSFPPIRYYTFT
jgi:hypothetical protein